MNEAFKTVDWARSTSVYEINLRQYTLEGTFAAFAQSLPRLKDMGVQVLWFMPFYPIGEIKRIGGLGSYYSIRDYKNINPEFGTLDDFKQTVNTAHQLGMKVIIDWVANHTAWDHHWTNDHPEFYKRDHHGNFISPYDWSDVIQLDHNSSAKEDAMIDAMKFWLTEFNIDGYRCDMAHLTPLSFWFRARKELDAIKPLFWLAETEDPSYHEVFDASYAWEFLHTMEKYWRREIGIEGLYAVLYKYDHTFPRDAIRMYFTSNHDENSHSGSEYERMGDAALPFAVLCATWNGIPLVYGGQELPLKRRLNFYNKDAIEWTSDIHLHDFYKKLLHLHASHPALPAGDDNVATYRIRTGEDSKVFAFLRRSGEKEVLVLLNLSPENELPFEITDENVRGVFKELFSGEKKDFEAVKHINMKGWGYKVFVK